jgi:hypothetical protein
MMRVLSTIALACVTAFSAGTLAQTGGGQTAKPAAPQGAAKPAAAAGQNGLTVTVKYTGKGVVDATHDLLIALLPTPTVSSESRPLAMLPVTKNGGVASFTNVSSSPVYVLAVYDDKGTWDPQAGPPPAGTPMGWYMAPKTSVPAPVKPGAKVTIALTFDGSKKFGQ